MTTAHTQAALRGALDCFDGKAVSLLSEAAVQWSDAPDYLDSLIALCGDDAPMVQSGASWLLLDHARQGGRLTRATGLVLEAVGLQLPLGAHCIVEIRGGSDFAEAEVVGFNQEKLLLMPFVTFP